MKFGHCCVFPVPAVAGAGPGVAEELERAVLAATLCTASSISRSLPALMARPLNPFVEQVEEFARYRSAIEGHGLAPEPFLDRTTVLNYVFLAPFDDPAGCAEEIATLRDAGVRRLPQWVGPGGVDHEVAVRSMRLFAEEVMPRFRDARR